MTLENKQKIFDAFPQLYRGKFKTVQESSMSFGFACGNGWFDLIWKLSQQIEDIARQERLDVQSDAWPEAIQVKEKFGSLRFHLRRRTEATTTLINQARENSEKICEECGLPGSRVADSSATTLCDRHAKCKWKKD